MVDLKVKEIYEGFKLLRNEYIDEISSQALIFEHIKTGAKLLYLKNNEKERSFSISFRTPPIDHTGLPHILEHSVLCGSKNFSIKDPFAQLCKGTINTFLNAFTFPDKTMYPFATTNLSEYKKLMHVYLDCVFNPNIYDKKEIFLQEGWRYDFDEEENLIINGVVYSEMKGANSSSDRILENARYQHLFPNNAYSFDFGGEPKEIPKLTYEKFLNFHKTYYHPSNSYIYLYGDLNILDELKFINNEYLSKYEKININSQIEFQKPFQKSKEITIKYPISKDEDTRNKYQFEYSFAVDKATNAELLIAFDILSDILIGTPSSPLRKALIDAKIGEDISGSFNIQDVILQPIINIKISNTNIKKKDEFKSIIFNTLRKIVKEGINQDLIKGAINNKEFDLKEKIDQVPVPIILNIDVMNSWLYDSDPLLHLKYNSHIEKIKNSYKNRYFENLIEKYLLKNKHQLLAILEPDCNYNPEKKIKEELKSYKSKLTTKDIQQIKEQNLKIKKWQEEDDKKEELDKIKLLSLDDIDKEPILIDFKTINSNNGKVLFVKDKTKNINYVNLMFCAKSIPSSKVKYLSLFSSILSEIKTKNYTSDDFSNLINVNTGGISYNLYPFTDKNNNFSPKLNLSIKYLDENIEKTILILNEIFNNIILDENKVLDILKKIKSRYEIQIIENGHIFAINRVRSKYGKVGFFMENTSGIEYYMFIKSLINNFETKKENILFNLQEIYEKIFNKNNLISSLVSENEDISLFNKLSLRKNINKEEKFDFKNEKINEAFSTTSQVNYVAKGFNLKKLGFEYNPKIHILRNLLGYGYLWEEIRMKGGAYGAKTLINRDGDFVNVTFRDPQLKNTLKTYDKIPLYLENINLDKNEIKKYIIGTIADMDIPLKPYEKGLKILMEHIKEITYEDLKQERLNIINITNDDLKLFGVMIKEVMKQNYYCVIGNSDKIEENKELFDKIINPFN